VLLDTSVVVEALLPNQPDHDACATVMRRLAEARSRVLFSRLLEIELWEVAFNIALRERHPRKDLRQVRYDNRIRPRAARLLRQAERAWESLRDTLASSCVEIHHAAPGAPKLMRDYGLQSYDAVHASTLIATGLSDLITRDTGFAALPSTVATLHTTQNRLTRTRARRRAPRTPTAPPALTLDGPASGPA
jgi:predicted nucleic acid-binding protein